MISLRGVSSRLGDFRLEGIDLDIGAGEYFVLLGPSGVGKTVLLEVIAGLLRPDTGRLLLEDRDITALSPEDRGFALVYQDYALFPHLDVLRNVTYGLRARSVPAREAEKRARDALELVGVGGLTRRDTGTLSGGEKQRVALARAMVTRPKILLLDEPLAAIDRDESERLRRVLKKMHRESAVTCLHVTHNVDEALYLADRIGVMLRGSLAQAGTVFEVLESPKNKEVARFLGLRNVFHIDSVKDDICEVRGVEIHAGTEDRNVSSLWIRPEDIILSTRRFESSARNQFEGAVEGWERLGRLFEVHISVGDLVLVSLVTQSSFDELEIEEGARLYCTFKSSAVHCF